MSQADRPVIGWREWVRLPLWLDVPIKAKIDSGARTSSIHSFWTRRFNDAGAPMVEFVLHPLQRRAVPAVTCVAPIKDERWVMSSNGGREQRIVVETEAKLGDVRWPIELTLADRDVMGFRMLLGREAIRRRFLIDPGRSFRQSRRLPKAIRLLDEAAAA
jgi:hypothetical protein